MSNDELDGTQIRVGLLAAHPVVRAGVNAYREQVASMMATILDGAAPVITLEDSRANVATLHALARSAEQGAPVRMTTLDERSVSRSFLQLPTA